MRCTLVCTVDHNTNLHEVGAVLRFGLERPIVRGVSFQLATYCGRHLDPRDLEKRATMPDVVKALVAQTGGLVAESDFYPLPCAHPNCHMMAYLYRGGERPVPINRFIDVRKHMDLIANSIIYTPARARQLVARYLESAGGCGCGPNGCGPADPSLDEFVVKALAEKLDRDRGLPHHADRVPRRPQFRHAPRHEMLSRPPAAERPRRSLLRL